MSSSPANDYLKTLVEDLRLELEEALGRTGAYDEYSDGLVAGLTAASDLADKALRDREAECAEYRRVEAHARKHGLTVSW